jgi:hypothetical protein
MKMTEKSQDCQKLLREAGSARIFGWRKAHIRFEIFDEVRQIKITESQCHIGTIGDVFPNKLGGCVLQSIALNHPLRANTHILVE